MRIVASPPISSTSPDAETQAARIHEIRALLAAGNYTIDLDKLASRLVDAELMRIRRSSGV